MRKLVNDLPQSHERETFLPFSSNFNLNGESSHKESNDGISTGVFMGDKEAGGSVIFEDLSGEGVGKTVGDKLGD